MTDSITPLQLVERMIDAGETTQALEVIVEIAKTAEADGATGRWLIGDLANVVTKVYGKNSMKTFATQTGIAYSTARQYKSMSAFYTIDTRVALAELSNIGYSHMREAMKLGESAQAFLVEASKQDLTVEALKVEITKRLGKPAPAKKLLDGEACVQSVDMGTGRVVLMLTPGLDMGALADLENKLIRVKFFEAEAA